MMKCCIKPDSDNIFVNAEQQRAAMLRCKENSNSIQFLTAYYNIWVLR